MRIARGEVVEEVAAARVEMRPSMPTVRDRPAVGRRGRRRLVVTGAIGGAAVASVIAVLATREHDRKHPETLAPVAGSSAHATGSDAWADPRPAQAVDPWDSPWPELRERDVPNPTRTARLTGSCEWCVPADGRAATMVISVRSTRPGGDIHIAGQELGPPPLDLTVKGSTKPLEIALELYGKRTRQWIVPDHDQTVTLDGPR
jgi:hypothetical protein